MRFVEARMRYSPVKVIWGVPSPSPKGGYRSCSCVLSYRFIFPHLQRKEGRKEEELSFVLRNM